VDYRLNVDREPEIELIRDLRGRVEQTVEAGDLFFLALSGGNTPRRLYELLAEEDMPWKSIVIVQTDERIVPFGHEDHNLGMICRLLLEKTDIPDDHIVAVDTEGKPAEYGRRLSETLKYYSKTGLDAAILGIGEDGHIASIFPGEADPWSRREPAYLSFSPAHPHRRVTMSLSFLSRAEVLYLLVKGERKRHVLRRLLDRGVGAGPAEGSAAEWNPAAGSAAESSSTAEEKSAAEPAEWNPAAGEKTGPHAGGGGDVFPAALLPKPLVRVYTDIDPSQA
jgi:6-phosphogluconolactonase